MNLASTIKVSLRAMATHKLRSILTILGIVIGISSVIMVFAAGESFKSLIIGQIESWGTDVIEVEIKVPGTAQMSSENAADQSMGVTITTLKEEDAAAIKKHPNVIDVYSIVLGQAMVTYQDQSEILMLWGTSASYIDIDASEVEDGRYFTDEESASLAKVAVIGSETKNKFFGDGEAIGKSIKIGNNNFKVIGVMKKRGSYLFMDMDNQIYLPLRSLQKLVMGIDHIAFFMAKLKDRSLAKVTAGDITLMMRDRHEITDPDKDDFAVVTMEEVLGTMNSILGGVSLLLIAIAGVSLIVGGVGIMNIMYVSVTERINEIGLRKAVGASPKNILGQFLWEAIALTFIGGILGIFFGLLFSFLTSVIATSQGFDWPFIVTPDALIIAVGVSMAIGLIFGLAPARKASKLDPIEALRYEY